MNAPAVLQLGLATAIFIAAASGAKAWALDPTPGKIVVTLLLYIAGNLIMMRLLRQVQMTTAFSLTTVFQLVAVNLVAIVVFGERVDLVQGMGIALAIVAVAMIMLAPRIAP